MKLRKILCIDGKHTVELIISIITTSYLELLLRILLYITLLSFLFLFTFLSWPRYGYFPCDRCLCEEKRNSSMISVPWSFHYLFDKKKEPRKRKAMHPSLTHESIDHILTWREHLRQVSISGFFFNPEVSFVDVLVISYYKYGTMLLFYLLLVQRNCTKGLYLWYPARLYLCLILGYLGP